MRVYAVLFDDQNGTVGINLKDSTLPKQAMQFEGLMTLFGGRVEKGEDPRTALKRELDEEIPGFISHDDFLKANVLIETSDTIIFAIKTDLSGHRHTRETDRIGQLAKVCREGDGVVRTIRYIKRADTSCFVSGLIKRALLLAFKSAS